MSNPTCEACGKSIPGTPVEVDDMIFCSIECAEDEALRASLEMAAEER